MPKGLRVSLKVLRVHQDQVQQVPKVLQVRHKELQELKVRLEHKVL